MSLAVEPLLPWAQNGSAESACRDETPTTSCRLVWNISHNTDFTRFYSTWLDGPLTTLLLIILTLVVALIVKNIAHRMITRVTLRMAEGTMSERVRERSRTVFEGNPALLTKRRAQRAQTLGSVLRSFASVLIMGTALFSILGSLGLNLAPILASASVIGVAVGFGAQNIVKGHPRRAVHAAGGPVRRRRLHRRR